MDRFITPLLLREVFPYRAGEETGWLFSKRYDHVNRAARSELNFRENRSTLGRRDEITDYVIPVQTLRLSSKCILKVFPTIATSSSPKQTIIMDPVDPFFSKFLAVSAYNVWVPQSCSGVNFPLSIVCSWPTIDHVRRDQASPSARRPEKMATTGDTAVLGHALRRKAENVHKPGTGVRDQQYHGCYNVDD